MKSAVWEKLAAGLGARDTSRPLVSRRTLSGSRGAVGFTCSYRAGSRNSPSRFIAAVAHPFPHAMTVSTETWFHRFAKRIGLVCEIQTGDAGFDGRYFVDCRSEEFARAYFAREDVRRTVGRLYAGTPRCRLEFGPDSVKIVVSPCALDPVALDAARVGAMISALVELAGNAMGIPVLPRRSGARRFLFPACVAASIVLGAGGLLLLLFSSSTYEPIGQGIYFASLPYSVPAVLALLWASFLLVRGRSSSGREFMAILGCVPGVILSAISAVVYTNGALDAAPPRAHIAGVINRYTVKRKHGRATYNVVPSWNKAGGLYTFRARYNPGDTVRITTKPGRWGYEWMVGHKRVLFPRMPSAGRVPQRHSVPREGDSGTEDADFR